MYRISKITDRLGNDKTLYDGAAKARINRIVNDMESNIMVGYPAFMVCKNDKSILTTRVRKMSVGPEFICFETRNSIYLLERIKCSDTF